MKKTRKNGKHFLDAIQCRENNSNNIKRSWNFRAGTWEPSQVRDLGVNGNRRTIGAKTEVWRL